MDEVCFVLVKKEHDLAKRDFNYLIKQVRYLRLEPFVDIEDNRIVGFEVLSLLNPTISTKQWFSQRKGRELVDLLNYQLLKISSLQLQERCFFNLSVLGIIALTKHDIKFISGFENVAIEVNEVSDLKGLSAEEHDTFLANLDFLRGNGIQIWLDDFTLDDLIFFDFYRENIDGIKINRREVKKTWLREEISIIKNVNNGVNILVEGIECDDDMESVVKAGARLAQGYLWFDGNIIFQTEVLN